MPTVRLLVAKYDIATLMNWRLLSLMFVLSWLPLTGAAVNDVQSRFEKSLQQAKSLAPVELEWLDTLWMKNSPGPQAVKDNKTEFCRILRYSYIVSGPKYRASCRLISSTHTNTVQAAESVFDGSLSSSYQGNSRYMVTMQGNPHWSSGESSQNPLVAPLMFLTKRSDSCLDCMLRFTDITSDAVGAGLTLPPGENSDGLLQISIPGPPLAQQQRVWTISIDDASPAFTPKVITMIIPGNKGQMVNRLLNYTNLGGYQFPSRIEWTDTTLVATGTVQLISARFLEQVSDSVFRLDDELASAETIWDATQKKFIKQDSPRYLQMKAFVRSQPKIYDESADGAKLMADALDRANQEGKHVLIEFGVNWCSGCHTLRLLLETNQSVSAELRKNYVVVMIDVNKGHNQDIVEKYGPTLFGLPTIAVSDMKGRKLTTQNVEELAAGDEYSPDKVMVFLKKWSPQK